MSAASTLDPGPSSSVDRPAAAELGETTTRGKWDRARGLARQESGLDDRGMRRANRTSTRGAARGHPRGMARFATRPPERDHLLAAVSSLRNLVLHYARTATWMFTLACAAACASLQLPLPNDNTIARALFLLAALSAGALLGKWVDRSRPAARRQRERQRERQQLAAQPCPPLLLPSAPSSPAAASPRQRDLE